MSTSARQVGTRRPGPLRGNRDFLLLWTAGTASGLGSQLTLVAYPLLVLSLGGTATQAGLVGTVGLLTRTLLRLPAGALADRWDRRRVMLGCDVDVTPEDMQGRVFSSMLFLSGAGGAAAPVLTGLLLEATGGRTVLLALGAGMVAVAGLSTASQNVRRLG